MSVVRKQNKHRETSHSILSAPTRLFVRFGRVIAAEKRRNEKEKEKNK